MGTVGEFDCVFYSADTGDGGDSIKEEKAEMMGVVYWAYTWTAGVDDDAPVVEESEDEDEEEEASIRTTLGLVAAATLAAIAL